jgi:hypothetical protein
MIPFRIKFGTRAVICIVGNADGDDALEANKCTLLVQSQCNLSAFAGIDKQLEDHVKASIILHYNSHCAIALVLVAKCNNQNTMEPYFAC